MGQGQVASQVLYPDVPMEVKHSRVGEWALALSSCLKRLYLPESRHGLARDVVLTCLVLPLWLSSAASQPAIPPP